MSTGDAIPNHDITRYLRDIEKYPLLTRKEELELAEHTVKGDRRAIDRMVQHNLRLVVCIARQYERAAGHLSVLDLISEGNVGLVMAAERYDPEQGAKFSTFASQYIKQRIRLALTKQSKIIRLPAHVVSKIYKVNRVRDSLTVELKREPTSEEIADELGVNIKLISRMAEASRPTVSLEGPIGTNGMTIADTVMCESVSALENLADEDFQDNTDGLLSLLNEREHTVIMGRFGMGGEQETLEELGQRLGIARERVRQIEEMALAKMRYGLSKIN